MLGAKKGPDGVCTTDGDQISLDALFAEHDPNSYTNLRKMENATMGTVAGLHRIIRGDPYPTLGFGCRALMDGSYPTFRAVEVSPMFWFTSVADEHVDQGVMNLPSWWIETADGEDELLDIVSDRPRRVTQLTHLPWSVCSWEEMFQENGWQELHRYKGGLSRWAAREKIGTLYLGFSPGKPVDGVFSSEWYEPDPLRALKGPTMKQVSAIIRGEKYEPITMGSLRRTLAPDHPLFNGRSKPKQVLQPSTINMVKEVMSTNLADADPSLAGMDMRS